MDIAAGVLVFDRPEYTIKCLSSIVGCAGFDEIDWYIFQDGQKNPKSGEVYGDKDGVDEVAELSSGHIKEYESFKLHVANGKNQGLVHQRHKILSLLKSCDPVAENDIDGNYDVVFGFEDDMVLGKYYLRLQRILAEQRPMDFGKMWSDNGSDYGSLKAIEGSPRANVWGFYMTDDLFKEIERGWMWYVNNMKEIDHKKRGSQPDHWRAKAMSRLPVDNLCEDIVLTNLVLEAGQKKLRPEVSRAKNIGKHGHYSYNPDSWKNNGMHNQPDKITYEQDKNIEKFNVRV